MRVVFVDERITENADSMSDVNLMNNTSPDQMDTFQTIDGAFVNRKRNGFVKIAE